MLHTFTVICLGAMSEYSTTYDCLFKKSVDRFEALPFQNKMSFFKLLCLLAVCEKVDDIQDAKVGQSLLKHFAPLTNLQKRPKFWVSQTRCFSSSKELQTLGEVAEEAFLLR